MRVARINIYERRREAKRLAGYPGRGTSQRLENRRIIDWRDREAGFGCAGLRIGYAIGRAIVLQRVFEAGRTIVVGRWREDYVRAGDRHATAYGAADRDNRQVLTALIGWAPVVVGQ